MNACPACGSAAVAPDPRLASVPGAGAARAVFAFRRCAACGLRQVHPPPAAVPARIFDAAFHDSPQQDAPPRVGGGWPPDARRWPIVRNALDRLALARRLRPGGRLLDVGCGKGVFVRLAADVYDAAGLECSAAAAAAARALGANVVCGDICTDELDPRPLDVVTFWDSLACVPDPFAALHRVARRLAPDGVVAATVPDVESLAARWLGPRWPLALPPINVSLFTPRALAALGRRCDLRIARFWHPGKWVDAGTVWRKVARAAGGRTGAADPPPGAARRPWAIRLNAGDIAAVIYRKA